MTDDTMYRYFVTYPGQPETEVDGTAWRAAELAAGFHSGRPGANATAGFTGINGIEGRIELRRQGRARETGTGDSIMISGDDLAFLRTYANGPRIWDAADLLPRVLSLASKGVIEPAHGNTYRLTEAGRRVLAREDEPEPWDDEAGSVQARSDEVAASLAGLGITAIAMPRLGGDGAEPGVWLGYADAELAFRILMWAKARGAVLTREGAGLPPLRGPEAGQ